MKVFRVQRKSDGRGPYWQQEDNHLAAKHSDAAHPTPQEEDLGITSDDFCGFASMRQLNKWFDKEDLDELHDKGYHLIQFEVPRYCMQVARNQAIFERAEARQIKTYSLKEI